MVTTYFRRAYSSFASHVFDNPPRLASFLFFILLLVIPVAKLRLSLVTVLVSANIYCIFSASWDLLVGRTGQISLGHALFFGVGAYTSALLYKSFELPPWITIPLCMPVGALIALLVGFPSLRVKGPYLALVTMALPIIAIGITFSFQDIFGGELGIGSLPGLFDRDYFPSLSYYDRRVGDYYVSLLVVFISGVILYKIANSKTGIVMLSILDDDLASKASGINVIKYKLMAFAISAVFGSLAGGIYAHYLGVANYQAFVPFVSFFVIIATFFGGIGTIYGPIAGSYVLVILDRYILSKVVEVPTGYHPLIYAIPIIILIILWPRGLARFVTDKLQDLQKARDIDERGPRIWKKYKKKGKK